jgi:hypothetical protein
MNLESQGVESVAAESDGTRPDIELTLRFYSAGDGFVAETIEVEAVGPKAKDEIGLNLRDKDIALAPKTLTPKRQTVPRVAQKCNDARILLRKSKGARGHFKRFFQHLIITKENLVRQVARDGGFIENSATGEQLERLESRALEMPGRLEVEELQRQVFKSASFEPGSNSFVKRTDENI